MANTPEAPVADPAEAKRTTHRSPNFPSLTLSDAIAKVRTVFTNDKRNPTTPTVILGHLGYGKKLSGSAGRVLSALRQYGLLEEVGDKLKVSDGAFLILTLSEKAAERMDAIRKAAQKPALFREVLKEYKDGLPSDATLRDWLIAQKGFNPASVDGFIRSFKATIQFANIAPGVYTEPLSEPARPEIQPGDYVQWESQGAWQFQVPKKLISLSDDGHYGFVEGAATGLPMDELSKVDAPPTAARIPPMSPHIAGVSSKAPVGVAREVFALGDGVVALEWPDTLDAAALTEVEDWLKLVMRKLKRLKAATPTEQKSGEA